MHSRFNLSPRKYPPSVRRSKDARLMSPTDLVALCIYTSILTIDLSSHVILGHLQQDFRCSHRPQAPEQVNHVWLTDANFSIPIEETRELSADSSSQAIEPQKSVKFRRQVISDDKIATLESPLQDSVWGLIKRLGRPKNTNPKNDLVPMKIQVHYDSSVYLLEKQKRNLINETVLPTVVNFFENVLSIRRDFTIDRFRMSRRCPNNTIYYARDLMGSFRPYCMERCEDFAVCGEMIVPTAHLSACSYCNSTSKRCTTNYASEGKGVANSQLLLYVSAKQTARCRKDQTIAYAAHCAQDAKTDRPVAGHANLCPSSISTDPKDLKALIATVKHELTHVLGFSVSLFAYYRDENGRPLTDRDSTPGPIPADPSTGYAKWSEKVIKKVVRQNWLTGAGKVEKEAHLVVTPTVVREVRYHFNCSTLEGAELEDQGSDGTSMTHWEKRLFENEAMTGTHTQNSVYSRLTLAVLQDTGWYVANFTRAESLDWGKNLGCDFAQKSCKSWINERRDKNLSIRPFCDRVKVDLLQIACTEDRTSKAVCNMKQYKDPLPGSYQNFDYLEGISDDSLAHYGGSVDLADYCPFIQEFTWQTQNVTIRGSRCDLGGNNADSERNAALEHYGPQTKCFEHGHRWEQRSCQFKRHWHHYGAGCYKYTCSDGHVKVFVGNHSYSCYYPDQLVRIEQVVDRWLYNGTLVCPSCEKVCPAHKCESYDKKLIDRIVSLPHHPGENTMGSIIEASINEIFEESSNSIDTEFSSKSTLANTIHEASNSSGIKFAEPLRYKEYLIQVFSQHRRPPRHTLMCSGANSSIHTYTVTFSLWLLISILFGYSLIK